MALTRGQEARTRKANFVPGCGGVRRTRLCAGRTLHRHNERSETVRAPHPAPPSTALRSSPPWRPRRFLGNGRRLARRSDVGSGAVAGATRALDLEPRRIGHDPAAGRSGRRNAGVEREPAAGHAGAAVTDGPTRRPWRRLRCGARRSATIAADAGAQPEGSGRSGTAQRRHRSLASRSDADGAGTAAHRHRRHRAFGHRIDRNASRVQH